MENPDSDICTIFFHGEDGNISMRYDMIKFLYTFTSVIAFDYRSYGKSTGTYLSEDTFVTDAMTIWTYSKTKLNYHPQKISLFGESIGSSIALLLATKLSLISNYNMYPHSVVLNSSFI